jgi:DNA-binding XRE family transcriptional regulator
MPGAQTQSFSGWLKKPQGHPCVGLLPYLELKYSKPRNYEQISEPKTLGEHLRNERLKQGLLQREVAIILSVSTSTIENWEVLTYQPQLKFYPSIIQFLGYTPDFCKSIPQLKNTIFLKRIELGLSQKVMAKELGIDASTLHQIEKFGRYMNSKTKLKLAEHARNKL